MEVKSVRLISNSIRYGPEPALSDEVEQRLTIKPDGQVSFSARSYEQFIAKKGYCRRRKLDIGAWKAQFLIRLLEKADVEWLATDCGSWELIIKYTDGKKEVVSGAMLGDISASYIGDIQVSLTRLLRRYIPIYGLMGFNDELPNDYEGKQAIHLFTKRWIRYFSDKDPDAIEFEEKFGNKCAARGFQMDCGKEFNERFPGGFDLKCGNLKAIVNATSDIDLLGSAVFSQWRNLTHWTEYYTIEGIRDWFLIVLNRMKELTKK
jgi:hypothetical protein